MADHGQCHYMNAIEQDEYFQDGEEEQSDVSSNVTEIDSIQSSYSEIEYEEDVVAYSHNLLSYPCLKRSYSSSPQLTFIAFMI